jgi:hypothetical protein
MEPGRDERPAPRSLPDSTVTPRNQYIRETSADGPHPHSFLSRVASRPTNSTEQSPSWEANSHAASQENFRIL